MSALLMTGGEMVVAQLIAHGIKRMYCVPGESYLAVIDALFDQQATIQQITCRHESGAGMMALAEASLSGRASACFVTRGPGATNASLAVHIAAQASLPLVLCIGQVATANLGRESFQEIDYLQFYGGLTKAVFEVNSAGEIATAMASAFTLAEAGRPGPVVIVFPEDVLSVTAPYEPATNEAAESSGEFSEQQLGACLNLISSARKPIILAGGSQWSDDSCEQLRQFSENNLIPVLSAFRRNDLIDNHSPSYAGYLGLNQHAAVTDILKDTDFILVLGARLDEPTTNGYRLEAFFEPSDSHDFCWAHVYPDFDALQATPECAMRISAHPSIFLGLCNKAELNLRDKTSAWYRACRLKYEDSLREDFAQKYDPELLDLPLLMREFNALVPHDTIVTIDAGNFTLWPQRLRQYARPGRLLAPINGAMGYGVPAAIAASLMFPERTVVCFVGDGGMLMTGMELATALKYGAKPIIIVFNNALYGTIDSHQRNKYPGRAHGNTLTNPDFTQFAESFGVAATKVRNVPDFANALLQARQLNEAAVIELCLHST